MAALCVLTCCQAPTYTLLVLWCCTRLLPSCSHTVNDNCEMNKLKQQWFSVTIHCTEISLCFPFFGVTAVSVGLDQLLCSTIMVHFRYHVYWQTLLRWECVTSLKSWRAKTSVVVLAAYSWRACSCAELHHIKPDGRVAVRSWIC